MEHRVVSREEWINARKTLLAKEKAWTRLRDQLSVERRELPWVRIDKEYVFEARTVARGSEPSSLGAASWSSSISCWGLGGRTPASAARSSRIISTVW
jgi:hypothetical protein